MGQWRYSFSVLDFGIRCRSVGSYTLLPLYPLGNSPWYPLDRRLDGSQNRCTLYGEEKI
jgi:hypothetical protein